MTVVARVARLLAPRELVFEDVELDAGALEPGSLFAETEVSAVSLGTERAAYVGDPPLRPGPVYPRLVGYCNVATVRASASPDLPIGARILTHQSHRSAFVCSTADVLARVPPEVTSAEASLTYLAHLGLAALRRAAFAPGERVAIVGLGAIGLATTALVRAFGSPAVAIGNAPERLSLALAAGASAARAGDEVEDASADLVVLTANTWEAWRLATRIAARFGRIAVLGFPGRTDGPPPFNPLESRSFYDKQLAIFGAGMPVASGPAPESEATTLSRGVEMLLGMIARGQLSLAKLVTHEVPWTELRDVYERAAAGDKQLVTALLRWRDGR
ncbi:MAG: hypothetical protein KF782_14965 [Labilithrix sp.]|nr:hypothetical protein [Labilithrix sp.]